MSRRSGGHDSSGSPRRLRSGKTRRRADGRRIEAEVWGSLKLAIVGDDEGFTLRGQADRIEVEADGPIGSSTSRRSGPHRQAGAGRVFATADPGKGRWRRPEPSMELPAAPRGRTALRPPRRRHAADAREARARLEGSDRPRSARRRPPRPAGGDYARVHRRRNAPSCRGPTSSSCAKREPTTIWRA